jgi:hypothetical protein
MLMLDELGQIENRYDYTEYGRRAMGNSDRLAQVMVRKGIKQSNRATYAVGWPVFEAEESSVCCRKSNRDDGRDADLGGFRRKVWWEAVSESVWSKGCQMEHDRMESVGSREVMECAAGKDVDRVGSTEEGVVHKNGLTFWRGTLSRLDV